MRREVERGRRLDRSFGELAPGLDPRDRAFAHELAYGATRLRGRLDHLIARHLHRGIASVDAGVLEVLRLGAFQVLYMGGVPTYAAVSESVERARSTGGDGAGKLANAVLRRVADAGDGPDVFPDPETDPAGFLETWGSHPGWLVKRWIETRGVDATRRLVEANNQRPRTYMLPLAVSAEEAVGVLSAAGIVAEVVGRGTGCVVLELGSSPAEALAALPDSIIQDPAAALVAHFAHVPMGTKVADLCAAPGGKALAVSENASFTLAADRSEARMRMVRENALRTGRRIGMVVADGRRPPLTSVDVVLLDVPCTGTGTLARHPDARWRLRPEQVRELVSVQEALLDGAAPVVSVGGILVYSTCTLEPEENEAQVDRFLERHAGFELEPGDGVPAGYLDARGRLVVRPENEGFDGSFAARLRRVA